MRGVVLLATLAAVSLMVSPDASGAPSAAKAHRALLADVRPEIGVEHRSLIVLPLVAPDPTDAPAPRDHAPAGVVWEPSGDSSSPDVVRFIPPAGEAPNTSFVPFGTLLVGGGRERITHRAAPVVPGEQRVHAPMCDSREKPAAPAARTLGAMAPLEQRKLMMLGQDGKRLAIVQKIQALLADAKQARSVTEVLSHKEFAAKVATRWAAVRRIPGAYAGTTVGHIAFFGFRAVEVVVCPTAEGYRAVADGYLNALCASHVLWEEAVGAGGRPAPGTNLGSMKPHAVKIVEALDAARLRKRRPGKRDTREWSTYRAESAQREDVGGFPTRFVLHLVTDGAGRPVLFEAIEHGKDIVYPAPLREVGGRPEDEGPDTRGGALTIEYLERLLERKRAARDR